MFGKDRGSIWNKVDRLNNGCEQELSVSAKSAKKAELLAGLNQPEIPLHTENELRCQVIKRKISGGTKSDAGRDGRDIFLSLSKYATLGISFWTFLGDRLRIPDPPTVPFLPDLIRRHAAMA